MILTQKLILSGLKKQHDLLHDAIDRCEWKSALDAADRSFYAARAGLVAENLKKLRDIQRDHFRYLLPESFC